MKSTQLLLILWLVPIYVTGQYTINIEAYIIDQQTQKPISYANIGFEGKSIGTVSSENGRFYFNYDEVKIKDTDTLRISRLGYKTIRYAAQDFYNLLTKTDKIYIQPTIESLDEVVIKPSNRSQKVIGYPSFHGYNLMAYWKDKKALGGEIGSLIKLRKENTKLHKLSFRIIENTADSLLVRVNIYDQKKGMPDKNLLSSNIYHTISAKKGIEHIDLNPYNVIMDDSFIVSLELIKVYGDTVAFAIVAGQKGKAYFRYVSQDSWIKKNQTGLAFMLEASNPTEKETDIKRIKPEHITLYWDTSLSMENRNTEKELDVLNKYFGGLKTLKVDLIPFSDKLGKKKNFTLNNGDTKELKKYLKSLRYNGGSNFSTLFSNSEHTDLYIVSSDGFSTFGKLKPQYEIPVFYMNSNSTGNHNVLQESGQFSDGHYINLEKLDTEKALKYLVYKKSDDHIYSTTNKYALITGKVFAKNTALQGCSVSIKGTLIETETDQNGRFEINANTGDVLIFNHFGTQLQEQTVLNRKELDINLQFIYNTLEEVQIETKKKDSSRIANEKNKQRNKNKLQGNSYTLIQDKFPKSAIYLSDIIRGRFPGVTVLGTGDQVKYIVRGNSSISNSNGGPLWIVDGVQTTSTPDFLVPAQIRSISLMSSLALTSRYGAAGANGVFIIETIMGISGTKKQSNKDSLLVKGNDYKESPFLLDSANNRPTYLEELWDSISYSEAMEIYYRLQKEHSNQIPFYIYSADYFKIWDEKFSEQIVSCIAEIAKNNYKALRALAFKLEETNQIKEAVLVYEKLKELKPDYPQSHLDLARIYTLNEEYQKAYEVYQFMITDNEESIPLEHCSKQLLSQFGNFLNNHRTSIQNLNVPREYLKIRSAPVRLVFDWNDPQAEFELQFINPNKKYYSWIHNYGVNSKERIEESNKGILSKEFVVDTSFDGQWIINIKSLGKNTNPDNPVFMKYTIYKNYGLSDETKEVKFLKLYNQTEKVSIDKFIM